MQRVRVTPRARNDLQTIGRYTAKKWGKTQRNAYLKAIERRFYWLAENPRAGRRRQDIHEDYCCFPQGEHIIFYVICNNAISIIGVLHRAMDLESQFSSDS